MRKVVWSTFFVFVYFGDINMIVIISILKITIIRETS
jgi:hypothetical protein